MDNKSNNAEQRWEDGNRPAAVEYKLSLHQPKPVRAMQEMLDLLDSFERIAEQISEDSSGDMGASVVGASGHGATGPRVSARDSAIASLPSVPVMRNRLIKRLHSEVRRLERSAKSAARSAKKGSAFFLNELYAKIRKIQFLMSELADAAAETVKRLYVKIFVDGQAVV